MSENKNDRFTIAVIAVIIIIFSLVDFFTKFGLLGELSVPHPTEVISFTHASFQSGRFFQEYENWEETYFYNRSKWEKILRNARIALGKKDVGGVYLGRQGRYFEIHAAGDYSAEAMEAGLQDLEELAGEYGARILLIPTADEIWKKDLPAYADTFDQRAYLERAKSAVGEELYINMEAVLDEHRGEKLYYSTDPHWTELAAYYGYYAWWEKSGKMIPYYYDPEKRVMVTRHFLGEYSQKTKLEMPEEQVTIFRETYRNSISILFDGERTSESYYRPELLNSAHPYDYFMGNDFMFAEITTGRERSASLVVIGDSYAGSMIPFLAPHYEKIYVINAARYQGRWMDVLKRYKNLEGAEFLLLQSVPDFLELYADENESK